MYRKYYKHDKHLTCDIDCYFDTDTEPITKFKGNGSAYSNAN